MTQALVYGKLQVLEELFASICMSSQTLWWKQYRGAEKSLAQRGRKQATAAEVLLFIYPIYNHNWRNINTMYIYNENRIK